MWTRTYTSCSVRIQITFLQTISLTAASGNDHDEDSDRESDVEPTNVVDKPLPRSGKRNAPDSAPSEPRGGTGGSDRGGRGGRRGGYSGNDEGMPSYWMMMM